ncbi:MAG: hypothetical protein U0768_04220 [Anaerolineae bacterium]
MTEQTVMTLWLVSLALAIVVTAVVGWLLSKILKTGMEIEHGAAAIWTTGKMVANNTIHIPLLVDTNRTAGAILSTAQQIEQGAAAIEQHADGCPGCPACVLSAKA